MARFDVESFRDYFVGLLKTGMAAKIAAINLEKNDGITLTGFTDAQYISDMNGVVANWNSYVFYGITDIQMINNAPMSDFGIEVTMAFDICFAESEGGARAENMILRYARAMAEIILENANKNGQIGSVEVEMFAPVSILDNQTSARMKIGGISVKGTIS